VNGGTKLQEVPEIKNCIIGAAPNSPKKEKEEALAKEKNTLAK